MAYWPTLRKDLASILPLLGLSACSGSGGGGGASGQSLEPQTPPQPINQSIGGIWEGTNSSGWNTIGIVTEDGDFHFGLVNSLTHWGEVLSGNAYVIGDQVHGEGMYFGFEVGPMGESYWIRLSCTLTGVVEARRELTLESDCEPAPPFGEEDLVLDLDRLNTRASLELTYNPSYEQGASLAAISGLYERYFPGAPPVPDAAVIRIASNGELFSQYVALESADGRLGVRSLVCTENGHVDVVDPAYNIYSVTYVTSCDAPLDLNFEHGGLATLDTSTEPDTLVYMTTTEMQDDDGELSTFADLRYWLKL
ncbi:MAG: hypothetical protein OXH63_14885 [Gemmatimonadetes bacterium]|nr:hypothetical protein [Gemmatimonadota bacterium]